MASPTFAQHLAQKGREDQWLFDVDTYDPATKTVITERFAYPREFKRKPSETGGSALWKAWAAAGYSYRSPLFVPGGALGFFKPEEAGSVDLLSKAGRTEFLTTRDLCGRSITIRQGGRSRLGQMAYDDYQFIRRVEIDQPLHGLDRTQLLLRSTSARLEDPLERRVLRGGEWCLEGDGATGYADFGDSTAAAKCLLGDKLTFQCWFMPYSLSGSGHTLLSWGTGAGSPFDIRIRATGSLRFYADAGAVNLDTGTDLQLAAGLLYHVAFVVDATEARFHLYDFSTDTATNFTIAGDYRGRATTPAGNLNFGRNPTSDDRYFYGWVDDIRLSSSAWTDEEIDSARFRPLNSEELASSTLRLCLPCDEATGPTLTDVSPSPITADIQDQTLLSTLATCYAYQPGRGNKVHRTTGSFLTDGWAAGDSGFMAGWTGDYLGNNCHFQVVSVSADGLDLYLTNCHLIETAPVHTITVYRYSSMTFKPSLAGGSDVLGVVCPNLFGEAKRFPGVRVDTVWNVWMLGVNQFESIDAVREGLSPRDMETPKTDWKEFTDALLAASWTTGKWLPLIHPCGTYVASKAPPGDYPITFDAKGDASGSGYVSSAADIALRVATTRGSRPYDLGTEVDTTAFDDLNDAALGDLTLADVVIDGYVSESVSIEEYLNRILRSVGAVAWPRRSDDALTVKRFEGNGIATPVATFTADDLVGGIEGIRPRRPLKPVSEVRLTWGRNWTVHSPAQITEDMKTDPLARFAGEPWRHAKIGAPQAVVRFPNAEPLEIETYIVEENPALLEGYRIRGLYNRQKAEIEIDVPITAVQIDMLDEIVFWAFERDPRTQERIDRLNTTSTTQWVVTSVAESTEKGFQTLGIWRKDLTAN